MSDKEINQTGEVVANPQKALLRLVYIMGIVLVLLFLTFIAALIWKSSARKATPPAPVELSLDLKGSKVLSSMLQGDRLLVTTETELIVVDIQRKTILMRARTK